MRIAVLLFGHLRTYEYCAPFFKTNLLDKFKCDLFMHTWDEYDSHTLVFQTRERIQGKIPRAKISEIMNLYKPKRIEIEHQNIVNDEAIYSRGRKKHTSLPGMRSAWYSVSRANQLRKAYEAENHIKYDIVFVTRPDILIRVPIEISQIIEEAKSMNIDLTRTRFFAGIDLRSNYHGKLHIGANSDVLYFGVGCVIDKYIDVNQNVKKEEIDGLFSNFVQYSTKKELEAGIMPLQIYLLWKNEWNIIRPRQQNSEHKKKKKEKSLLYKILHMYWVRGK